MEKMTKDMAELSEQEAVLREYHFKIDSSINKQKKNSGWTNQFEVFVDSNLIKVSVQSIAIDIPEIDLPNFDSIAIIIHEATQNVRSVRPPAPPMTVGNKGYNYEYNTVTPKRKGRTDVNLDSLMQINNMQNDKNRVKQKERMKSNSKENDAQFYYNDSLILLQNNELKKEMDNLRKELKRFRENFQDPQQKNNDTIKEDSSSEVEIIEI
jgi:hypothetical protein